jgi:hypothetical protein
MFATNPIEFPLYEMAGHVEEPTRTGVWERVLGAGKKGGLYRPFVSQTNEKVYLGNLLATFCRLNPTLSLETVKSNIVALRWIW